MVHCKATWCDFCIALEKYNNLGMTPEYLNLTGENPRNRELCATPSFRVTVALGPIMVGNLLISSNHHITSMSQLNFHQMEELVWLKSKVKETLINKQHIIPCFFEHGVKNDAAADGCISHAHLQVMPIENDLLPLIKQQYDGFKLTNFLELCSLKLSTNGYLLYETKENESWVFPVNSIESQYIRKIASTDIGRPEYWNWRKFPQLEFLYKTIDLLGEEFKKFTLESKELFSR